MSLTEYFRLIEAPNVNAGAPEAEIVAAEARLDGCLPDTLRGWFREADGFDGEAGKWRWRFRSLQRLRTITEVFEVAEMIIAEDRQPDRRIAAGDYAIFCDAMIYCPFYAVNIRLGDPHYSEVVMGIEEDVAGGKGWFISASFDVFAHRLTTEPMGFFLV